MVAHAGRANGSWGVSLPANPGLRIEQHLCFTTKSARMHRRFAGTLKGMFEDIRRTKRKFQPPRKRPRGRLERLEDRLLLSVAPEEQLFVYELNRARHDPVAYQQEQQLSVDLSYIPVRGPLAIDDSLYGSAGFHAEEMATYNYFGHQSQVTGDWPNKMARDHGYQLPTAWADNNNYIESIAAGGYDSYATSTAPLRALIVDAGVPSLGHRHHLLGYDDPGESPFYALNREIGIGHAYNAASNYRHYWAAHVTRVSTADLFLTGVVFNDLNSNSRYDLNEGLAGVTVSAGGFNTTSNSQGGWAIQVTAGTYTVTAFGAGFSGSAVAEATVGAENVEVDFISGQAVGYTNFQLSAAPQRSTVGLYAPGSSTYFLNNSNACKNADLTFGYGPGGVGWIPLVGDWNGDGTDTIGLYAPNSSAFYLNNDNATSNADLSFSYGPAGFGWIPIAGDWNGDGVDTVGLYAPNSSTFFLTNSNATGNADLVFGYGPAGAGWMPLAGDWDGDGVDTVGLYAPNSSTFFLSNSNATAAADLVFGYGPGGLGWTPMIGDWDADGTDTVGLYAPNSSTYFLNNVNATANADLTFGYGPGGLGWQPLSGDWNGPAAALHAAGGETLDGRNVAELTQADLQPIVTEALARWEDAGLETDRSTIDFVVADLPGSLLGLARLDTIYLDVDAAGRGWFVDATPGADEEFQPTDLPGSLAAVDANAVDRIDLLSVVSHELGHLFGLDDLDADEGLMSGTLQEGLRRLPDVAEIDAYFAQG